MEEFFSDILEVINFHGKDIRDYSPLVLAYLGDAVYEVFIRTLVVSKNDAPVCRLHKCSTAYVKAN